MKTTNYMIQIPKPCHEDWNAMKPGAQGKFCDSCSKSVIDFSNKTDLEITNILLQHKDQKVCGHFKSSQVNRPLTVRIDLNNLPKNVSSTKTFAIALFLVFGTFLFSCNNLHGQKINTIEVINIHHEDYTTGKIMMPRVTTNDDTIPKIDTTKVIAIETFMNGGIRFVETPAIPDTTNVREIPPVIEDLPLNECFIMGEMIETIPYSIPNVEDSIASKNTSALPDPLFESPETNFLVYPNPSTGEFIIRYDLLKKSDVRVDIFDMQGNILKTVVDVISQYEGRYSIPVSLPGLPNGTYIITLINDGKKLTEKLIIEK